MKKRILALAMAAVMAGSLTACSGSSGTDTKAAPAETEAPASESKSEAKEESKAGEGDAANTASSKGGSEGYELALVTDLGTIDDKSFNQGAWEGLKKYAEENSISYKYYQPQEGTTDSCLRSPYTWPRTSTRMCTLSCWTGSPMMRTTIIRQMIM